MLKATSLTMTSVSSHSNQILTVPEPVDLHPAQDPNDVGSHRDPSFACLLQRGALHFSEVWEKCGRKSRQSPANGLFGEGFRTETSGALHFSEVKEKCGRKSRHSPANGLFGGGFRTKRSGALHFSEDWE